MPFTKNDPNINKEGRPKGSRDFATDFDEVVKDIAKENNLTVSDVRKVLLKQAYKQAKDGNYSFYKDIHDRVYGQAQSKTDITSGGQPIQWNEEKTYLNETQLKTNTSS